MKKLILALAFVFLGFGLGGCLDPFTIAAIGAASDGLKAVNTVGGQNTQELELYCNTNYPDLSLRACLYKMSRDGETLASKPKGNR